MLNAPVSISTKASNRHADINGRAGHLVQHADADEDAGRHRDESGVCRDEHDTAVLVAAVGNTGCIAFMATVERERAKDVGEREGL